MWRSAVMERIKVAIRIKPEPGEGLRGFGYQNHGSDGLSRLELFANGTKNEFTYDHIFGPQVTQVEIFETICLPIINRVLEGFNGTLFAYGQTGAGKTHTVTGPAKDEYNERGLCMRTVEYIFRSMKSIKDSVITVRFSVIEIYNDTVMDLLRESLHDSPKLVIVDTPNGVIVPALYLLPIENEEEAFAKLYEANLNRSVAEHQLNRRSSRSHAIYSFYITRTRNDTSGNGDTVDSKLHLVDLAGSERIEKTGSTGGLVKEATHINKSLSFLEQVVLSLTKKAANATLGAGQTRKDFIPAYRQSKLTYILKDSLGGNCNTVLVCCIWPHVNHLWETISSLRFASRMRCIENHPQRNSLMNGSATIVSGSTRTLQLKIESLKKELIMRDMMCGYAMYNVGSPRSDLPDRAPILDTLTKPQLISCQKMTHRYIMSGAENDIDIRSLAEVRAMANIMRSAIWTACEGNSANVAQLLKEGGDTYGELFDGSTTMTPNIVNAPTLIQQIDSIQEEESTQDETQSQEAQIQPRPHGEKSPPYPQRSFESPPAVPKVNSESFIPVSADPDLEEAVGNSAGTADPFEVFKQGEGKDLHQTYESLKFDLKESKNRQKALVKQVNQTKLEIDSLTDQLQSLQRAPSPRNDPPLHGEFSPRPQPSDEVTHLQRTLSELKSQYKQARNELIYCKEEIVDLNRRKQLALNALVSAYESYVSMEQARMAEADEGSQRDYGVNREAFESLVANDILRQRESNVEASPASPT